MVIQYAAKGEHGDVFGGGCNPPVSECCGVVRVLGPALFPKYAVDPRLDLWMNTTIVLVAPCGRYGSGIAESKPPLECGQRTTRFVVGKC